MGSSGTNGLKVPKEHPTDFGGPKKFEMKNFGVRQRQIEEEVKKKRIKSNGSTPRRPEGPEAKTALEMNQQGNNEKENPMQLVRT